MTISGSLYSEMECTTGFLTSFSYMIFCIIMPCCLKPDSRIPDPTATKPDDWDEDAPPKIPDADAVKPDGWMDDGPEFIPDPDAEQPDDW